uniref:Uncharacterized protein n=1 Tax=Romanomermis culicivorax TaxID=13658 RepID=A0A915L859_ROMCU
MINYHGFDYDWCQKIVRNMEKMQLIIDSLFVILSKINGHKYQESMVEKNMNCPNVVLGSIVQMNAIAAQTVVPAVQVLCDATNQDQLKGKIVEEVEKLQTCTVQAKPESTQSDEREFKEALYKMLAKSNMPSDQLEQAL